MAVSLKHVLNPLVGFRFQVLVTKSVAVELLDNGYTLISLARISEIKDHRLFKINIAGKTVSLADVTTLRYFKLLNAEEVLALMLMPAEAYALFLEPIDTHLYYEYKETLLNT